MASGSMQTGFRTSPGSRSLPAKSRWNPTRANTHEAAIGRTVGVGLYSLGRSTFGIEDMAGNAWEWCLNEYDNPRSVSRETTVSRVLRGGSWLTARIGCRCAYRLRSHPGLRAVNVAFRVCCSSPIE